MNSAAKLNVVMELLHARIIDPAEFSKLWGIKPGVTEKKARSFYRRHKTQLIQVKFPIFYREVNKLYRNSDKTRNECCIQAMKNTAFKSDIKDLLK